MSMDQKGAWNRTVQIQLGGTTQPSTPPFGRMRFEDGGQGTGMKLSQNDSTGFFVNAPSNSPQPFQFFVDNPKSDIPTDQLVAQFPGTALSTAAIGIDSDDLTSGSKRERDQGRIMGDLSDTERTLSATKVAQAITEEGIAKLPGGNWEWLHLVAFSIGPNKVLGLSDASSTWLESHEQTAQISENLILGTKEANSAMLTFETALKNLLVKYECEVNLVVLCMVQKIKLKKFSADIPVANELKFEYQFVFRPQNGDTVLYTSPASITFSLISHQPPSFGEFEKFYGECEKHFATRVEIKKKNEPRKIGDNMENV
jgi:hypothetical protein